MGELREIFVRVLKGFRKTAVFAITTRCNCRCVMCDMHRKKPEAISLQDAERVLDFLARNNFIAIYITGGEPSLHPDLTDIVRYARSLGIVSTMTTNGTADPDLVNELKEAGLYLLTVSLDHWDPRICEAIRKHPGIREKQIETLRRAKDIGMRVFALAFLNPFLVRDGVGRIVKFSNTEIGVPLGFCYPVETRVNSYRLGGTITQRQYSEMLGDAVETLRRLKGGRYDVSNLGTYVEDLASKNRGRRPNFYCRGGQDVIYVDWRGDVYPCFLREKLFNILEDDEPHFMKNVRCNDCFTNCFREPSLLPQIWKPHLLLKEALYSFRTRDVIL